MKRFALWGGGALVAAALVFHAVQIGQLNAAVRSHRRTCCEQLQQAEARGAQERKRLERDFRARAHEAAHLAQRALADLQALRDDCLAHLGQVEERTHTLEAQLAQAQSTLADHAARLDGTVLAAAQDHSALRDEVARLRDKLEPDVGPMYERLIHPSVQVNGHDTVGGGTMIHVEPEGDAFSTYILSAYHVIQKVVRDREQGRSPPPVQVRLYHEDGREQGTFPAEIVAYEARRDIALLRLRLPERPAHLAVLASRERMQSLRLFHDVVAVGCPLGHDPLPTFGQITSQRKIVSGETFWMVSAPTIFGNSGGGIFDRQTLELIGVSALICTYDGVVSTPVPHMSVMVSIDTVYDWLDTLGLERLYRAPGSPAPAAASLARPAGS